MEEFAKYNLFVSHYRVIRGRGWNNLIKSVLLTAAGKTTFLELLRKYYPEAILVSEPINKWQNIPAEKEVVKEARCVFIV